MARRRFLTGSVASSVEAFRFAPLEPECEVIQFDRPLSPPELQKAASIIRGRPDVELYVYGTASRDLDFLRYFDDLRRLSVHVYQLQDISGLSHLSAGLEELVLGDTRRSF